MDTEVMANRPDIVVKHKKDKTCLLINVAIPADKNVIQKEVEKKLKYKNLSIEIQRMWNMKCFVIPVIFWATRIVSKSLQKYLETIPGQHSIDSLQKTAILRTSHMIRKVLQAETRSLSGGAHHWLKSSSTREERKPVTRDDGGDGGGGDDDDDDDDHNNNNNNTPKGSLQNANLIVRL
jgi:hypothetical protein